MQVIDLYDPGSVPNRLYSNRDNEEHSAPWAGVKAQVHLTPRMGTYTDHRRIQMAQNGGQKNAWSVISPSTGIDPDILEFLREGAELVVHRLDRLGRSTRDVLNLVHELDGKGASLRVLEPEVTTAGDLGRLVVTVLGMVADMELKFIRDRQRAGIEAAKKKGVYKGRQKQVDEEMIRQLAAEKVPKARIARDLKISRMSVYRALKNGDGSTAKTASAHTRHDADKGQSGPSVQE